MELIETLRKSKDEFIVGYIEFLRVFTNKSKSVYCFVEAKDDKLYYSAVLKIINKNRGYEIFICDGKDGVLSVFKLLKDKKIYKKAIKGFFVDSDFDKNVKSKRIYKTPCHSIENFYCEHQVVEDILSGAFGINKNSADLELCMKIFKKAQDDFHSKTIELNSFLACYADIRQKIRDKRLPRLHIDSKVKFSTDLISNDLQEINIEPYTFEGLDKLFVLEGKIKEKKFRNKIKHFGNSEMSKIFRGKFEILFVIVFLKKLKLVIENSKNTFCSKQYTSKLVIKPEDFITVMNVYSIVPNCLKKYVRRLVS